jgi:hypothetical protein
MLDRYLDRTILPPSISIAFTTEDGERFHFGSIVELIRPEFRSEVVEKYKAWRLKCESLAGTGNATDEAIRGYATVAVEELVEVLSTDADRLCPLDIELKRKLREHEREKLMALGINLSPRGKPLAN